MRVIAGLHRGRDLLPPPSTDVTRPITDRAKQSLFDILSPRIDQARVLDCFSGTGSLGIECLSRGAASAIFIERDRAALARLRRNLKALRIDPSAATVLAGDAFRLAPALPPSTPPLDLVFLDPPYRFLREQADALAVLAAAIAPSRLAGDGLVILRHSVDDEPRTPALRTVDLRTYGTMAIRLMQAAG